MCSCDYNEQPKVYDQSIITARKPHKCYECRQVIPVGAKHERMKGLWDTWEEYRTCQKCLSLRGIMLETEGCTCWTFGEVLETCYDLKLCSYWDVQEGQEQLAMMREDAA
jgi:hypothetical protein